MKPRFVHDVSALPNHAFGRDSILWWGTLGFVAIEGTGFVLVIAAYFYLMREVPHWPPANIPPPGLLYGSALAAVLLVSAIPNHWAKQAGRRQDLRGALLWSAVVVLLGLVAVALRGYEFTVLNVRWDSNAYGSILWVLLGLHTLHLGTDIGDTIVLMAVLLFGHITPRRFTDVTENADYWYFVVLAWLPVYAVLYLVPRLS